MSWNHKEDPEESKWKPLLPKTAEPKKVNFRQRYKAVRKLARLGKTPEEIAKTMNIRLEETKTILNLIAQES
ncbi:MAG: hypothetical protein ACXABY_09555 [Candidatus Thorarchaeota archaeon]